MHHQYRGYKVPLRGRLAQLVERLVYTENVGGSSPSPPTISLQIKALDTASLLVRHISEPQDAPCRVFKPIPPRCFLLPLPHSLPTSSRPKAQPYPCGQNALPRRNDCLVLWCWLDKPRLKRHLLGGMKYTEIRQHVTNHFQEKLRQFEDWIDTNGPPDAARREKFRTAQSFAAMRWSDWSDLMGRDYADDEAQSFCTAHGIDWAGLSDSARGWLQEDLRRGQHAYWVETLARIEKLDSFEGELRSAPTLLSTPVDAAAPRQSNEHIHLSYQDVVEQYFTEVARSGGVAVKTDADKRAALTLLAEITAGKPVSAFSKADAQRTKQILRVSQSGEVAHITAPFSEP